MSASTLSLCIVTPGHSRVHMGGAEYQIDCLLDVLLPKNRYEVSYLAAHVAAGYQPDGYRIVRIGAGTGMPKFGYMMQSWPLYRSLARIRPEVIYQRVGCGYTGVAAYYARRNAARLIWHVAHDSDVMREGLDQGRNPVRRFLEKRSIEYGVRHAHHIVVQTEQQARLLELNYGRQADAVIPNFHPEPVETIDKTGPVTVLWVANLKRWKQPEPFIRLAASLSDLKGVRFLMVGSPEAGSGDREWSNAVIRSIESTPNLEFLGRKSQQEVNELLAQAHVFVNTSLYEGFANTFIQAWMREVPVVTLNVNPDGVFDRERVGIHAGSEERLLEAVRMLATDPVRRAEYAACARAYALRRHSVRNAELIANLIDRAKSD